MALDSQINTDRSQAGIHGTMCGLYNPYPTGDTQIMHSCVTGQGSPCAPAKEWHTSVECQSPAWGGKAYLTWSSHNWEYNIQRQVGAHCCKRPCREWMSPHTTSEVASSLYGFDILLMSDGGTEGGKRKLRVHWDQLRAGVKFWISTQ